MVRFSIIVPVYNVEKYLSACLNSVCCQQFEDFEVICVNDGSTDQSGIILDNYTCRDSRIVVLAQENRGLSAARNVALKAAKGDYIIFLDSDDLLMNDALMTIYENLANDNPDILMFDTDVIYDVGMENSAILKEKREYLTRKGHYEKHIYGGKEIFKEMMSIDDFLCPVWLYVYKRDFLEKNMIFFVEGIIAEDIPFTFETILKAGSVKYIKEKLYIYRVRGASLSSQKHKELCSFEEILLILFSIAGEYENDTELLELIKIYIKSVADRIRELGINFKDIGEYPIENYRQEILERAMGIGKSERREYNWRIYEIGFKSIIENQKSIFLYGAGEYGKKVLKYLKKNELMDSVKGYIVSDGMYKQDTIDEIPVFEIGDVYKSYANDNPLIIISTDENWWDEIEQKCDDYGFNNIIILDKRLQAFVED